VVVLIPTIAALVFGGLEMESALSARATYARVETLAKIQPQLNSLVAAVQAERTGAAGLVSTPALSEPSAVAGERASSDSAVNTFRSAAADVDASHDPALRAKLQTATAALGRLGALRASADSRSEGATTAMADYTQIVTDLTTITDELATQRSNSAITGRVNGVQSLAAAREAAAQQQGIIYAALLSGSLTDATYQQLIKANAAQYIGIVGLLNGESPAVQSQYRTILSGTAVGAADAVVSRVLSTRSTTGAGMTPAQWLTASAATLDRMTQIQADQVAEVDRLVKNLNQDARNSALTSGIFIVLILAFAALATLLAARSILRPLRTLRAAALGVAYDDLPETVRRLQDGTPDEAALAVTPIGVRSTDEIGQVARAFDAVHTEAVQLAGQQALMRGNVNKMFINLSRRSQSLVERQLRLIDDLEASEQDADQLANLFKLDHLATRMRRNDESLLVLAGDQGVRRRSDAVAMLDVLRAANSEVEQYNRVQLDAQPGFELAGAAVSDVVHLIAELIENATTFSSPSTLVWVRSHSLGVGGEMMIEVEDHGIGMAPAEMAAANEKLEAATGMDVSMSRLMGLFVVGRLAQRHGIRVQLRPSAYGGVTAFIRLPAELVTSTVTEVERATPVVEPVGSDTETSPIFEALQSEWFTSRPALEQPPANGRTNTAAFTPTPPGWNPDRPDRARPLAGLTAAPLAPLPPPATPPAPTARPVPTPQPPAPVPNWMSPGDSGWRQAAALRTSDPAGGTTAAGLPVRVPGRNLLPGAAEPTPGTNGNGSAANGATNGTGNGVVGGTASRLTQGLSSYQRGVSRARGIDEPPADTADSDATDVSEVRS
jgi:signal transduction histidine kinase